MLFEVADRCRSIANLVVGRLDTYSMTEGYL